MGVINKTIIFLLAFSIIYFTIFPRTAEVFSKNYLFGFDQGRDYLSVKQIVVDRKPTLIGAELGAGSAGLKGIFHGPGYYYFLSIPFFLMHGDPYGGQLLMFSFGLATIIFSIFFSKNFFNSWNIALLTGLFIAMCPILVPQARFIWNSHPSSLFVLLVFFFYSQYLHTNKTRDLFLSGFFSGFIYNFQTGIAIPLCVTVFLFTIITSNFKDFKKYFILLSSYVLAFLPLILFEIRHGFQAIKGYIEYLHSPSAGTGSSYYFWNNLKDHFGSFNYNFFQTFPEIHFLPSTILFLLFILGIFFVLKKEKKTAKKHFIYFLLFLPFVTFFIFSFLRNAVYQYYLTHLNIAYIILVSYIGYYAFKYSNKFIQCIFLSFVVVLIVINIPRVYANFMYDYQDYGGDAKIKGRIDAVDYLYKQAKYKPFNVLIFAPPIYTYAFDYVFWWHGNEKYGFMPVNKKEGTVYLLIEKDPGKPWSYEGWLETVIKVGKVEYTKKLPSGFIIQKRKI